MKSKQKCRKITTPGKRKSRRLSKKTPNYIVYKESLGLQDKEELPMELQKSGVDETKQYSHGDTYRQVACDDVGTGQSVTAVERDDDRVDEIELTLIDNVSSLGESLGGFLPDKKETQESLINTFSLRPTEEIEHTVNVNVVEDRNNDRVQDPVIKEDIEVIEVIEDPVTKLSSPEETSIRDLEMFIDNAAENIADKKINELEKQLSVMEKNMEKKDLELGTLKLALYEKNRECKILEITMKQTN